MRGSIHLSMGDKRGHRSALVNRILLSTSKALSDDCVGEESVLLLVNFGSQFQKHFKSIF
jgi:hypothetical protein